MKPSIICIFLLAAFLGGCNESVSTQNDHTETPDATTNTTMRISVFQDGRVDIDGQEIAIDEATNKIRAASGTDTQVLYFREAGQEEPHPNAMKVIAAIADASLPISLSTKPDFSTYVDADGIERPRE